MLRSMSGGNDINTINTAEGRAEEYEEIIEGQASMLYAKNEAVFYNKVQVLNRDLSIQVISEFSRRFQHERDEKERKKKDQGKDPHPIERGITILDALAATGLRSIRYVKEIPGVRHVYINDLLPEATAAAKDNASRNKVDTEKITITTGDAVMLMYQHRDPLLQFDVVDLDPYGSASPFLDSAVQAVSDGGLLCVTCTDMPVLSGNFPEVCYAKYGAVPLKAKYTHEMALRILLHAIDSAANKYKRHIEPWLSMSIDFYVRVFVRIHECPKEVKYSCTRAAYVLQSTRCPSFYLQPVAAEQSSKGNFTPAVFTAPATCTETGGRLKIGGPVFSGPIHSQSVVDSILARVESFDSKPDELGNGFPPQTLKRLHGLLVSMSEELKDAPLFYHLPELASVVHSKVPSILEMHSALIQAGYRVSQFHHEPGAVKTDAPNQVVWDIMREYCKLNPPQGSKHRSKRRKEGEAVDVADMILSKPILTPNISFEAVSSVSQARVKEGVARFPPNPEEHWGPKRRAGRLLVATSASAGDKEDGDEEEEKEFKEIKKPKLQ